MATQVALTFDGDPSTITKDDITITNTYSTEVFAVKSVSVDGNTIYADTFKEMKDAKVYDVAVGDTTLQFTATDGVINNIQITPLEITVNKANVTVVYTKYTTSGLQYVDYSVEGTATITAVESTDTLLGYSAYYLASNFDIWSTAANQTWFTAWNTTLPAEEDIYAYFGATYSESDPSIDFSEFYFESSDGDLFTVSNQSNVTSGQIILTPYKAGSGYVIMKSIETDEVVYTFPITFEAARYVASIGLDKKSVTVSYSMDESGDDNGSISGVTTDTVAVTVYDQYGRVMIDDNSGTKRSDSTYTVDSSYSETEYDGKGKLVYDEDVYGGMADGWSESSTITMDASNLTGLDLESVGSRLRYTTTVSTNLDYGAVTTALTITVQVPDPAKASTYGLVISGTPDAAIWTGWEGNGNSPTTLTATMYEYKNGIKYNVDKVAETTSLKLSGNTDILKNRKIKRQDRNLVNETLAKNVKYVKHSIYKSQKKGYY